MFGHAGKRKADRDRCLHSSGAQRLLMDEGADDSLDRGLSESYSHGPMPPQVNV